MPSLLTVVGKLEPTRGCRMLRARESNHIIERGMLAANQSQTGFNVFQDLHSQASGARICIIVAQRRHVDRFKSIEGSL